MTPPPDGVPNPLWRFAGWIVGLVITGMGFLIGYFGKRHIDWREERVEALKTQQDDILKRPRAIEDQMASDHGRVSGGLAGIRDQLNDIQNQIDE